MSSDLADLTLSVFLLNFRRELVEYRKYPGVDMATPGEVLDFVVVALDRALKQTKGEK